MPSRETDLATIKEWRDLGFFYDLDEKAKIWLVRGDRNGLFGLVDKIKKYANDPRNHKESEHDHLGPYMYLKVMTSKLPELTTDAWSGSPMDLIRLADLIEENLKQNNKREFFVGEDYSKISLVKIHFIVEIDGFDPSSVDRLIRYRN